MRFVLIAFALLTSFAFHGHAQSTPEQRLQQLVEDPALEGAQFSLHVRNLDTKATLLSHRSSETMVPASVLKLLTTGAALNVLGPDHQFTTGLGYTGTLENGILHGDLIIVGGGDPTLGSKYYVEESGAAKEMLNEWTAKVLEQGINQINGRVLADASYFSERNIPSTWIFGDIGNYYGAGPSGLSFLDNTCTWTFKTSAAGTGAELVEVSPQLPGQAIDNQVVASTVNRDQAYIYGAPYSNEWRVEGSIPANRNAFSIKGSLPDPAMALAFALHRNLRQEQVTIAQPPSTHRFAALHEDFTLPNVNVFYQHQSPPVDGIVGWVNLKSVNLFAEHLAIQLGIAAKLGNDAEAGAKAVKQYWANVLDEKGLYLHDGSGLSRFNGITTEHLTAVLAHMATGPHKNAFVSSLPVMGQSGSLANMGKGTKAAGNLRAKSGYMTRVRSYAGYYKNSAGETIAFAVMVNNYHCSAGAMKKKLEQLMVALMDLP